MAGVPRYGQWESPMRQEQREAPPLPSLLSYSGKTEPAGALPPLALVGPASRPVVSSSFGPSSQATDSLIRPVLPRYDYQQPSPSHAVPSWGYPAPASFALAYPQSSGRLRRPVEGDSIPTRSLPEKRRIFDEKPRELSLPSPPTWTRQAEPATEQVAAAPERRPRVRTQRRREQCRTNQARYRMRQNQRIQHMEDAASRLREEIALLLAYRARWSAHDPSERMSLMARYIVEDYFRRFRSGVSGANIQLPLFTQASNDEPTSPSSSTSRVAFNFKGECNSTYTKQVAFLRTVFLADADVGDGLFGPDAVLEQWWRYSCFFKRVHLALDMIAMGPRDDESQRERVIATGTLTVKISNHSMQRVFPHLEPGTVEGDALKDQLVELPVRAQFEFVPVQGSFCRIASVTLDIDVVPELLRVVGNMDALERVLAGALISPHGYIGGLEDHPTGDNAA